MITKNDFDNIEDEPYPPEVYKVDHAVWAAKNTFKGLAVADAVAQYCALSQQILGQWCLIDWFILTFELKFHKTFYLIYIFSVTLE